MSLDDDESEPADPKPSPVGYGRPPAEHQYVKGQSGNPKGRPRKHNAHSYRGESILGRAVLADASRTVTIMEAGKARKRPILDVAVRSLGNSAAKGDPRARDLFAKLFTEAERNKVDPQRSLIAAALEYQQIMIEYFAMRERKGQPEPCKLPHPLEIYVDLARGEVIFNGPRDSTQERQWIRLLELADRSGAIIETYVQAIQQAGDDTKWIMELEGMIRREKMMADFVRTFLPDAETRRAPAFNIWRWRRRKEGYKDFLEVLRSFQLSREREETR